MDGTSSNKVSAVLLWYCFSSAFITLIFQFPDQSVPRQSARLFACPFYKHEETAKSGSPKDCSYTGGGFKNMAEVTRHLKQQHKRKLQRCKTCKRFVLTSGDHHAHQNDPIGCQRRALPKGPGQQTLWFDLYALLFPKSQLPPSPYYPRQSDSRECQPKFPGCIATNSPPKGGQAVRDPLKTIEVFLSQQSPCSRTQCLLAIQDWAKEQLSQEKDQPLSPRDRGNVAGQSQETLSWENAGQEAGAVSLQFQYGPETQICVHLQKPGSEDSTTDHVSHYAGASQGSSNALWNEPPLDQLCSPLQWNPQDLPTHFQGDPDHHFADGDSRSGWGNDSVLELFSSTAPQSTYRVNYQEWIPHSRFQS